MNRTHPQPADLLDCFHAKEFLLFGPHQIRTELAHILDHRAVDLLHDRAPLQTPLGLALEPRCLGPWLDGVNASHRVPEVLKRPHAHEGCLSGIDRAQ